MNHTPEPWTKGPYRVVDNGVAIAGKKGSGVILRATERFMCRSEREANAKRAADCMNALACLNPEGVRDVVEALNALVDVAPEHDYSCSTGVLRNCTCDTKPAKDQARAALAKVRAQS